MNVEKLWPSHFRESESAVKLTRKHRNDRRNKRKMRSKEIETVSEKCGPHFKSENCGLAARLNYSRRRKEVFGWFVGLVNDESGCEARNPV